MLIVKNIAREGPGILGEIVRERGIASETIELDQRQRFPPVDRYDAIVILGGPDSANDKNDKMREELARLREAMDIRKPCLGVCLGLQALVKTAGSRVAPSPVKEVGFRDPEGELYKIELTEKGRHDPLFQGLGSSFHVFQLHGETVELADGMLLLAPGKYCRNQVVRIGSNAYGIQCHFELTPEMFESWINEDPDLLKLDKEALRADFASIRDEYTRLGRRLLENFLAIAGM